MATGYWNHNIHYHPTVLQVVPHDCVRAMDVGCGQGFLTASLVHRCKEVVAIDIDHSALEAAKERLGSNPRVSFILNDIMSYPFPKSDFDLIASVATLHHLPLESALVRFRDLLRPGGVLAVVGLYKATTPLDFMFASAAFPTSWTLGFLRGHTEVGAPVQDPKETLREVRKSFDRILPGTILRRRLLFRYTAVWKKPRN